MSQTLAVAARELRERWLVFPVALVVGFAPFLTASFHLPSEQAPVVALLVAMLLGAIVSVMAGSSMLARDAADGRLGFLFSRPVPWPAIWGGKWLASLVLVVGSASLAVLPVVLAYPPPNPAGSWRAVFLGPEGSSLFVILLVLGIGVANFIGIALRSRSPWGAADAALLLVSLSLVRRWVVPLLSMGILFDPYRRAAMVFMLLIGPVTVALVAASAVQVAVGRTDLRRGHRAMSLTFWCLVMAALSAAGLRLAWARAATPADVVGYAWGSSGPSGRWLYLFGPSRRGGDATFLIDADRGRYAPMGVRSQTTWRLSPGMAFAADGGSGAVLLQQTGQSSLLRVALTADEPVPARVDLESSPSPTYYTRFALSASGATVVLAHDHGVSLYELPSGRRLATTSLAPGWRPAGVRFLEEHAVRVWLLPTIGLPWGSHPPAEMRITDLGVGGESRSATASLETVVDYVRSWPLLVLPDSRGLRVLTHDGALHLRDGVTGALVATLHEGSGPTSSIFLGDGRVVVGTAVGARSSLSVFSPDGAPLGEMEFEGLATSLVVGPEVAPGRVAALLGRSGEGPHTLVVDLDERRVVETLPALQPLRSAWPSPPSLTGGSRHFFLKEDASIVRHDFSTGEERVLAGPGAPRGQRLALEVE